MFRIVLALVVLSHLSLLPAVQAQVYRYEAETGQMFGTHVSNAVPGYSGTGYVTGFTAPSGSPPHYLQLQVDVPTGLYEMWVGYRSQFGPKGYDYQVDDVAGSAMFDHSTGFTDTRTGLFNLADGPNTLRISQGWGWYDVDYLEFRPFSPPELLPISAELVNPHADATAQVLMNYLVSQYGHNTLSGQQHEESKNLSFPVQNYLNKSGGIVPAIRGSDFMEYSPSRIERGANPRNETEQSIQWAQETGGIVTMMWHWNAPKDLVDSGNWLWWRGFYTNGTTFDLPGALANPQGQDYQLILRDIDAIGDELQKFQQAGVPVLWRPLHEAQGGWFWWGAHGPDTFKELWNLMYDRLTHEHGLNNLIWEYTTSAAEGNHLDWYPGDDVVDMVGLDVYTDASSNMSGEWYNVLEHYNGRKMLALSETGTLPDPDVMEQFGIHWSYFSPWNGTFVDAFTPEALQHTLGHDNIVNVDDLPVFPWKTGGTFLGADLNFDGVVDGADLALWEAAFGESIAGDMDFDGTTDGADFLLWQRQFTGSGNATITIPEPGTASILLILLGVLCGKRRLVSG